MILYRDARREVRPAASLARLSRSPAAGGGQAALELLVELGELEQGVLDALHQVSDRWGGLEAQLRRAMLDAGSTYLACLAAHPAPSAEAHQLRLRAGLNALARHPLPERVTVRPPEGYVHYALDPAAYAAAAADYAAAAGTRRARRALVVGVRSIGTSLSAVVAAALGARRAVTVRPRGRTGARHIAADSALRAYVVRTLAAGGDALVVDEGPGATGETFAAVASWLRELGAADERIVLMPCRTWGMPLAPESRRAWFAAARKYPAAGNDSRPAALASRVGLGAIEDLSAGRWRDVVPGAADQPAYPLHERRKYRAWDSQGNPYAIRYAGLGVAGHEVVERAAALADAGLGPPVVAHAAGFLVAPWAPGRPAGRGVGNDPRFLAWLRDYLCARARLFRLGAVVDRGPIIEMLLENAAEALGAGAGGLAAAAHRLERLPPREAVVPDARLQAREWICTPAASAKAAYPTAGYAKADALDHGDGLRLPGPTDSAWDLAGAAVEFELADSAVAALTQCVAAAGREGAAELAGAVAACRAPYAALCLGEAALGSWEAITPADKRRLEAEAARYLALLRRELLRSAAMAPPAGGA